MYREKECEICGKCFLPKSGNQKYCDRCKSLGNKIVARKRDRERNRKRCGYREYNRVCPICKKQFSTFYKKKLYCGSLECEVERQRINNRNADKKRHANLRRETLIRRNKKRKSDLIKIEKYLNKYGYRLLDSSNYISSHRGRLKVECPHKHKWETTFHGFKNNKARCFTCYTKNNYTSRIERKVRDYFVNKHPDLNILFNDRNVIYPKELDLYFPDYKVAVEVCGLYWHSDTANGVKKSYHFDKTMECYKKGIRLITVFEDEINNKFDIVTSIIEKALNITDRKIYAKDCEVVDVDFKTANKFFNGNHILGKSFFNKSFGLIYNNQLVAVMSVGNVSRFDVKKNVFELNRFCTLNNTFVVGGANKLFKYIKSFVKLYGCEYINYCCDMRYTSIFNSICDLLGFNLVSSLKYRPHYFKRGVRYSWVGDKKPESQLINNGFDRIWDCGHRIYSCRV